MSDTDRGEVPPHPLKPLRYAATCHLCQIQLPVGAIAVWDRAKKQATCETCVTGVLDRGVAGASAAREGERRRDRREKRIRAKHPRLGGLILGLTDEPRSSAAWTKGSVGERALGAALETLRAAGLGVLHDRRIPGSKANIDHIVIGPAGIFAIDAKRYAGKVERRDRGMIFARDWRLYVGGRDQSKLLAGMPRQTAAVREVLDGTPHDGTRVIPVICFVDAKWDFFSAPLKFGDVHVMWPKELMKFVQSEGSLSRDQLSELERTLAMRLPASR